VEAARIISTPEVVVANDSGLMHCAGSWERPWWDIRLNLARVDRPGRKVRIAHVKTDCSPCFKRTCRYKTATCLARISADMVLALMNQLVPDKI